MVQQVLFIIGSPRSGSTLAAMVVGSHSRAFAIGELDSLGAARRRQDKLGRSSICECCPDGDCPVWGSPRLHAFVEREVRPGWRRGLLPGAVQPPLYRDLFDATGAEVLIDSSKNVGWLRGRLATRRDWRGVVPRVLFVTRDGRGTLNSLIRQTPDIPVDAHALRWRRDVDAAEAAFLQVPADDRLRVAYEDLAEDPDAVGRRITDFLGLAPEPALGQYWQHTHHVMRGNLGTLSLITGAAVKARKRQDFYDGLGQAVRKDETWRHQMTAEQLAIFDQIAGAVNADYVRD